MFKKIALLFATLSLAACQAVPPPADGVAYTGFEYQRVRAIQAQNNNIATTAVVAGVIGLAAGAALASDNNGRTYNTYNTYNGPRRPYYGPQRGWDRYRYYNGY